MLCFFVVMQSFIMNSNDVFIHIHQGCFAGTGAIVRLPQCQWSKPDGYGKISQCITTTKHSKAKTVCIFLGIYCTQWVSKRWQGHVFICRSGCWWAVHFDIKWLVATRCPHDWYSGLSNWHNPSLLEIGVYKTWLMGLILNIEIVLLQDKPPLVPI